MRRAVVLLASLVVLAACADKPAQLGTQRKAGDTEPWAGTQTQALAEGFKTGDAAGWKNQIRARNQAQNEYVRGSN